MSAVNKGIIKAISGIRPVEAERPANTIRVMELAEELNIGKDRARDIIKGLIAEGKMEVIEFRRENIIGRKVPVVGYRLLKKPR